MRPRVKVVMRGRVGVGAQSGVHVNTMSRVRAAALISRWSRAEIGT